MVNYESHGCTAPNQSETQPKAGGPEAQTAGESSTRSSAKTEVRRLSKAGFIYPVEDSEWVSPVVVTPKKNDKWRVCVDYKPLNAATKRDHFLLPFQDEILNEVAGHERYTVCDRYQDISK